MTLHHPDHRIGLLLFVLLLAMPGIRAVEKDTPFTIEQGTLGASKIMIAVPKHWNKQVLIFAHGLRMANEPLTAEFSTTRAECATLLNEGWLIASTSYRRNGSLHDEAIEDIDLLRKHVIETYGQPEHIYLIGTSMGGAIVTTIAETHPGQYDGVLAIGAALRMGTLKYSFAPRMPLLFISNQNELADPKRYREKAADAPLKPAVWLLKRDGHCNLNDQEELVAFRALTAFHETGKIEDNKDITIVITPPSVARFHDGGASAAMTGANIDTLFVAADFEKLGIKRGDDFSLTFTDKTVKVRFGASYFDVPRGDWVAFVKADGYTRIARNYANATEVLGCKVGDELFIQGIPKAKE